MCNAKLQSVKANRFFSCSFAFFWRNIKPGPDRFKKNMYHE